MRPMHGPQAECVGRWIATGLVVLVLAAVLYRPVLHCMRGIFG